MSDYRTWFREVGQTIPPADTATKEQLKMLEDWGRVATKEFSEQLERDLEREKTEAIRLRGKIAEMRRSQE